MVAAVAASNMDPKVQEKAREIAQKKVDALFAGESRLQNTLDGYAKFSKAELQIGKVLGKGGFGIVSEISGFCLDDSIPSPESPDSDSRRFLARHCLRENGGATGGHARYAVKCLSPTTTNKPSLYVNGIIDMAVEARMLANIEHPNIITLRATASCSPFQSDYFIIMDRLYDTLEHRIASWGKLIKRSSGLGAKLLDPNRGEKVALLYEERLSAAYDLATAIDYLHQKRIVYRDLKAENVAFDVRNDIKLFDFGLAKELKPSQARADGTYNLTALTGSPRHMAPEVANSLSYNETCDSYSFAILFWQIMSCKVPYELYTPQTLRDKVYNGLCKRPPLDDMWNESIKEVMRRGWEHDLHRRSKMNHMIILLKKAVTECGIDEVHLEHTLWRGAFMFRRHSSRGKGLRDITDSEY